MRISPAVLLRSMNGLSSASGPSLPPYLPGSPVILHEVSSRRTSNLTMPKDLKAKRTTYLCTYCVGQTGRRQDLPSFVLHQMDFAGPQAKKAGRLTTTKQNVHSDKLGPGARDNL